MTSIEYSDYKGMEHEIHEVFSIVEPRKKDIGMAHKNIGGEFTSAGAGEFPHDAMRSREDKIIYDIEKRCCEILSVKSELISKRRYKRRLAKENKRRAKSLV